MAYLHEEELQALGFASLGRNVRVSDRAAIHGASYMRLGDHSRIDDFCVISGRVSIGRNVHITPLCVVAGGKPGIFIEDFVALAYRVSVFAQSDDYTGLTMTNSTVPARFKREIHAAVQIRRHSIVGAGAIVCPGVELAEGTAVGAGAVVLKSSEPWTIIAGIPAQKLRDRSRELIKLEAEYLKADP